MILEPEGLLVLAEVRCKTCRKVLEYIAVVPRDWDSYVRVQICQQHGDGAGRGNIRRWQERQRRAGKDPDRVRTGQWIPWSDLRPAIERTLAAPHKPPGIHFI